MLNVVGLPTLTDVLPVTGLKSNLISISQLCDNDLDVLFDKHLCVVVDRSGFCVMTGTRATTNC